MIEAGEITRIARKNSVSDRQIEKDYVLSWLLFAVSKNEMLRDALAFKGGTVLKKAYFEKYRFSEDKDLPPFEQVSRELGRHFRQVFKMQAEQKPPQARIAPKVQRKKGFHL